MNLQQLQDEQKGWQNRNFGEHGHPHRVMFGVIEEIGELSHATLKGLQGIRVNEDHEANAQDAVVDTLIYLCGYMNRRDLRWSDVMIQTTHPIHALQEAIGLGAELHRGSYELALLRLIYAAGKLAQVEADVMSSIHEASAREMTRDVPYYCRMIFTNLCQYCTTRGWNLEELVIAIWAKVKARDWTANKTTGDTSNG